MAVMAGRPKSPTTCSALAALRRIIAASSSAFPAEKRGLSTVISGEKKAEGSISIGMVMPERTPNSSIAASYPAPARISTRGISTMLAEEISLPSSVASDTGTATEAMSPRIFASGTVSLPLSFLRRKR